LKAGKQLSRQRNKSHTWFPSFARATSRAVGHTSAFGAALALIVLWACTGPYFRFSDTWQLVINTGTTVVTFLMVFVIQQTQNRDSEAMHVKLDEIIRSLRGAQNELLDIEELTEEELDVLRSRYLTLARKARDHQQTRRETAAASTAVHGGVREGAKKRTSSSDD